MNDSIVMIVITLFTHIIVFLACTFSPYIAPRGIFFGVRLDSKYKKEATIKPILKTYLLECTAIFIVILALTLGYMMRSTDENQLAFAMTLSPFILMLFCFIFFVRTHKQIKAFAHTLETPLQQATKTVIDTDLMREKDKLRKYFRKLYILPLVLIVFSIVYSFINYSTLPELIPTHWNLWGEADAWQVKTPMTVMMQNIMQLLLYGVLYYVSDQIFTTRGKLDTADYEESKKALLSYLRGMGYSLYLITVSIILLFTLTTFSTINGLSFGIGFVIFGLILPILGSLYMILIWIKYRKNRLSDTSYSPEDDERHWILGSLYYNPDDPSLFIEKRYGIGWTINIGHPAGKVITALTIILILGSIFLPLIVS